MAKLRLFEARDLEDLYRICLATGEAGSDAQALYADPKILGHVFAAPYGALVPETSFVLEDDEGVGGYILGALDTRAFEAELEARWWPPLRRVHPDPVGAKPIEQWTRDERMAAYMHHPPPASERLVGPYPSHLHIDLLPRLQGQGWGRRMLDRWFETARGLGSVGAHLGVSPANARALRFYRAYGLAEFPLGRSTVWFVRPL